MARAGRHQTTALIDELFENPRGFDFFQAVRLLECSAAGEQGSSAGVGDDHAPQAEAVRFRTRPSLTFAVTEVADLRQRAPPSEMEVAFLGFVGTVGVLPQHYTELLIERLHLKDSTLRDFLDLFHHRLLSFFYRAWCKYRFPIAFERAAREHGREDAFTGALYSLVGTGTPSLRRRLAIGDVALAYQAGHFARAVRTAVDLEDLLSDLFGVPVLVEQFVGRWLALPPTERCRLPRQRETGDVRVQLGAGATLGSRTWDVQSKIRIHVGPLGLAQLEHLAPDGPGHRAFLSIVHTYIGIETDFDLCLELREGESPGVRLVGGEPASRLGRNTWLENRMPVRARRTARFALDRS